MKFRLVGIATCLVLAASCSKKEGDGAKDTAKDGDKAGDKGDVKKDKPAVATGPFGAFDAKAVQAKLQGDWVIPSGIRKIAWHVEGNKIKVKNGDKEETHELVVESPCTVKSVKKEAGGSSSTTHRFAWEGDKLIMGGDLGVRNGDTTVACISADIYTLKADKCQKWRMMFDKWKSEDAECSIAKEGDAEHFVAKARSGEVKLAFTGDVLKTSGAKAAEKMASWDEAVAAIAK